MFQGRRLMAMACAPPCGHPPAARRVISARITIIVSRPRITAMSCPRVAVRGRAVRRGAPHGRVHGLAVDPEAFGQGDRDLRRGR